MPFTKKGKFGKWGPGDLVVSLAARLLPRSETEVKTIMGTRLYANLGAPVNFKVGEKVFISTGLPVKFAQDMTMTVAETRKYAQKEKKSADDDVRSADREIKKIGVGRKREASILQESVKDLPEDATVYPVPKYFIAQHNSSFIAQHNPSIVVPPSTDNPNVVEQGTDGTIKKVLSELIKDIPKSHPEEYGRIILPVVEKQPNWRGKSRDHWVTVVYDPPTHTVTLIDSRPLRYSVFYNTDPMEKMLLDELQTIDPDVEFKKIRRGVQSNDICCGAWTVSMVDAIAQNPDKSIKDIVAQAEKDERKMVRDNISKVQQATGRYEKENLLPSLWERLKSFLGFGNRESSTPKLQSASDLVSTSENSTGTYRSIGDALGGFDNSELYKEDERVYEEETINALPPEKKQASGGLAYQEDIHKEEGEKTQLLGKGPY